MNKLELLDEDDGENLALRYFLTLYGGTNSVKLGQMCGHLAACGFDGCWPQWVVEAHPDTHLTKGAAQLWIRHLLGLENAQPHGAAQSDSAGDAKRVDWLEAQQGCQLHQPITMPGTVSESTGWLITDPYGEALGEGKTLREAIDAASAAKGEQV